MGKHRDCLEHFTCYFGQPDRKAEFLPKDCCGSHQQGTRSPCSWLGCDWKCFHLVACPKKSSVPLGSTP